MLIRDQYETNNMLQLFNVPSYKTSVQHPASKVWCHTGRQLNLRASPV